MASQYFSKFCQLLSVSSINNLTPPTFAGISGLVANADGSLTASYAAATGISTPIRYLVYIAAGSVSAATLFQSGNIVASWPLTTSAKIYVTGSGATLTAGQLYSVGVRAMDAVGNIDSNIAILTATVVYNLYALVAAIPTNPVLTTDSRLNNLDSTVSSRASQTSVSGLITTIGTPTGASVSADIAAVYSSVNTTLTLVSVIPTNPLLTNDPRLNTLGLIPALV